jgi:hypothetical protein
LAKQLASVSPSTKPVPRATIRVMKSPEPAAAFRRRVWLCALLSVAVVVAITFLLPGDLFLSSPDTDLIGQLAAWRAFAVDNILAGHFPLWNPYAYAGQPFLGDFQSAELYPPNVIFLFLPLARAVNLSFLLHLLLLGWGMGYWVTRRGGHPLAGAVAGFALALSGPVFLRLFAGHLANICTMAWAPWMFCALEAAWHGPRTRPLLLAAAVICLEILGGHPQYVFYLAIAAGFHAVVYSVAEPALRRRALPNLALAYLGGLTLSAAQLLPGLAAIGESVRQSKLEYNFVRMFSFPPENLLTLIAPNFFGNLTDSVYWGRCYLWEASLFISVSGLVLAALAFFDPKYRRHTRLDFLIAVPLGLLALGDHTPLLRLLYNYIFGFGEFRSLSKFDFPVLLFVALGIGAGADALIRGRLGNKFLALSVLLAGVVALLAGGFILTRPNSLAALADFIQHTHESYLPAAQFLDDHFQHAIGTQAGRALATGGILLFALGAALLLARRRAAWRWVPLALAPLEMLCFAYSNLGTAHLSDLAPKAVVGYIDSHPGDYRILNPLSEDNGYFLGKSDLWGNDPTTLKRYSEFMAFTQGIDPNHNNQYIYFRYLPKIFSLLRFRLAFVRNDHGYEVTDNPGALPRALLVSNYEVRPTRDAIFAELNEASFDPGKTVLLESDPSPRPQPGIAPGLVKITDSNCDSYTFEIDTPTPALLLITDLYCSGWRARALPGSVQTHYEILPADYIIRAIPLAAGHHHLIVEYAPASFRIGLVISGMAWLVWTALLAASLRSHGKSQKPLTP